MPPGYRKASDLPQVIPVFPLDGALLLPGGQLPLNVFEPRYLNMFDDAMAGDRIIGMVQTLPGGDAARPSLATIGCAGRVTSFSETPDGRYLVTLTGLCRFKIRDELPVRSPYRQVRALFGDYEEDLDVGEAEIPGRERETFLLALRHYLDHRGLDIDWASAESAHGRPGQQPVHGPALRAGRKAGLAGDADGLRPLQSPGRPAGVRRRRRLRWRSRAS